MDLVAEPHQYKFTVLSRTKTNTDAGMGVVVTVSVLVGERENLSLSGTISMTEDQWLYLAEAMRRSLGNDVEIEDRAPLIDSSAR